jgi:hypothetical protein
MVGIAIQNQLSSNDNSPNTSVVLPVPKRENPYTWAKRAEYFDKDLSKAEVYY